MNRILGALNYYTLATMAKDIVFGFRNLMLRATSESSPPPRWLVFEVTDACNSHCKHCNVWRKEPTKGVLTSKEIEKVLNDDLFRGLEYIILTGGEPTLRHDLEEIILTIHKTVPKAKVWLSTNGLLPQRVINVVKVAIEHNVNIGVGIPLDGLGEKHDLIRGVRGNFKRVNQLLHELIMLRESHRDKVNLAIGFTLSNLTLHSIKEVMEYAERAHVNFIAQMYDENGYYGNVGKNPVRCNEGLIKAVQLLPYSLLHEKWLEALMGKSIKFLCFAMYTFCLLRCNGDVTPCLRYSDIRVGNVRENSPSSIWHCFAAKKARRLVKGCEGCLNDWGTNWSFQSCYIPILLFNIKRLISGA